MVVELVANPTAVVSTAPTWVAVGWVLSVASAEVVFPVHSFEVESSWSSYYHPHHPVTSLVTSSRGPVAKPWSSLDTMNYYGRGIRSTTCRRLNEIDRSVTRNLTRHSHVPCKPIHTYSVADKAGARRPLKELPSPISDMRFKTRRTLRTGVYFACKIGQG